MIQWRRGVVVEVRSRWAGAVEYAVRLASGDVVRALGYVDVVGSLGPGTAVLLNTTSLERGLGTGGLAIVVAAPDALPRPVADVTAVPGHVVKARYTPSQTMVLGVDEQDSEHHAVLADADDLAGLPVVVADLHSALPAVLAGLRAAAPSVVVAYVMTDGGALPLDFSRTVAGLRSSGWLEASITVGQAFGGDLEAVNVHTGLLAAHHVVGADVVVVSQGPGNLGTGTRRGRWAAGPSARCGSPRPTRASGTAGCRTTASRPTDGCRSCPPTCRYPCCRGASGLWCSTRRARWRPPARVASRSTRWRPTASTWSCATCRSRCARWAADTTTTAPGSSARPSRGGMPPGCCSLVADPSGPDVGCAQRTSSRSTTKISVSPGAIAEPAPRSP